MTRFGFFDHMERRGDPLHQLYRERLELLERADRAGFWCYHKAEHHFIPLDAAPSSLLFLAAVAQRTHRLRFGPLVALLPFYDPLRLIEEVCALDHLSGGRLELGVGKGISPAEHVLWGHAQGQARSRFEETFAILRKGLSQDVLDHEGEFYRYHDVPILMKPFQQPRPGFWYPGNVEYAGAHRLHTVVAGPAAMAGQAIARYRDLVAACSGDDDFNPGVAEPTVGVMRHLFMAETDQEAVARARQAFAAYHRNLVVLFEKYDVPFSGPVGGPSLGGDADLAMRVEVLVAGSPQTIREHVEATLDAAGTDYFVGAFSWGDLTHRESMRSLDLFAQEVMPHFAAAA